MNLVSSALWREKRFRSESRQKFSPLRAQAIPPYRCSFCKGLVIEGIRWRLDRVERPSHVMRSLRAAVTITLKLRSSPARHAYRREVS